MDLRDEQSERGRARSLDPVPLAENDVFSSWPLVGNEGMNPQYTNVKVDSLIPY